MAEQIDTDLSDEQAAYYQNMLAAHTGSRTGDCTICRVPRCPDWTGAFDRLAMANRPMAEPDQWDSTSETPKLLGQRSGARR